jgi:predicted nucleotidyltransferase
VTKTDPNSIDDKDVMGVMVLPRKYYIGLQKKEQTTAFVDEWDVVVYEVKKFMSLLLKNNPNVLGTLWLAPNLYTHMSEEGRLLVDNRHLFLSKQCYSSFCGYAHSQLHRMTHMAFEGYMGQKRKELVAKNGYDTKNAAHLVRLLRMGIEALTEGHIYVFRHDAEELKSIKKGEWTLQQVHDEANRLFKVMEMAYVNSKLPAQPDKERAEKILMEIISESWRKQDLHSMDDSADEVC